jgi:hypothetical protein
VDLFYQTLAKKNQKEIGKLHLILVEGMIAFLPRYLSCLFLGTSRKSDLDLKGRTDTNKKVSFH